MKTCAVIPAAGRGTRLGLDIPKILVPITEEITIWNILETRLAPHVSHLHVILAPSVERSFQNQLRPEEKTRITTSAQAVPRGMGDAIFGAYAHWKQFDTILIVWGDQVNLSASTVAKVMDRCGGQKTLALPLTRMEVPYVQYDIKDGHLVNVRQQREGAITDRGGLSDIGVFALSVQGLEKEWKLYLDQATVGEETGEVNFLPFLVFLSNERKWQLKLVEVADENEARGVNTADDLQFARQRLAGQYH
jgi:bifunctional UDP-N-acetylglucosamine pyrophosphorylase/glucosamine-1-phosphate N-acetyltransferase